MTRMEQAPGREISDLTVTDVNLFHLVDLRPGEYNHRPYRLGWGHHHCNTVARDKGVRWTVAWMADIVKRHGLQVKTPEGLEPAPPAELLYSQNSVPDDASRS
jgi:hypothetical protein